MGRCSQGHVLVPDHTIVSKSIGLEFGEAEVFKVGVEAQFTKRQDAMVTGQNGWFKATAY